MLRALGLFAASTLIAGLAIFTSAKEASATGAVTFFAVLNGQNECDGGTPPQCHQGDLNGYGAATILLIPAPTPTVCFGIVVNRLSNVTLAHIHLGASGVNGGIVITLTPDGAPVTGNPNGWGGCSSDGDVTSGEIAAIKANPQNYYVNVHTSGTPPNGFPAGAIRGQLF
jgi:hypothetical protein